jgi:hypothetical protein
MQTIQTHDAAPPTIAPDPISRGYLPPAPSGPGVTATPAPPPVRPHSALGRLTVSLAAFALGVVVLIDVAGAHVPASTYFATPLAVVAAGLVLGAWYGRARGLIGLGVVLTVLLAIAAALEGWNLTGTHDSVNWRPAGFEQVAPGYRIGVGDAVLDLSAVNFTGHTATIQVHLSMGNLDIVLPSTVDVEVHSTVKVGDATVLGQEWGGIGQGEHIVTDTGADGPGGGHLTITAVVNVGDLEVRR